MAPRFRGRSGFHSLRDVLSFVIGCSGLVYVLLQPDGVSDFPAITIFAGLIGAPYVLQRDEKPRSEDDRPVPPQKRPIHDEPAVKTKPKPRQPTIRRN